MPSGSPPLRLPRDFGFYPGRKVSTNKEDKKMQVTFMVKTKVGDIHSLGSKEYRVVKVRKIKRGWSVEMQVKK